MPQMTTSHEHISGSITIISNPQYKFLSLTLTETIAEFTGP
jgi:hypothetical protein